MLDLLLKANCKNLHDIESEREESILRFLSSLKSDPVFIESEWSSIDPITKLFYSDTLFVRSGIDRKKQSYILMDLNLIDFTTETISFLLDDRNTDIFDTYCQVSYRLQKFSNIFDVIEDGNSNRPKVFDRDSWSSIKKLWRIPEFSDLTKYIKPVNKLNFDFIYELVISYVYGHELGHLIWRMHDKKFKGVYCSVIDQFMQSATCEVRIPPFQSSNFFKELDEVGIKDMAEEAFADSISLYLIYKIVKKENLKPSETYNYTRIIPALILLCIKFFNTAKKIKSNECANLNQLELEISSMWHRFAEMNQNKSAFEGYLLADNLDLHGNIFSASGAAEFFSQNIVYGHKSVSAFFSKSDVVPDFAHENLMRCILIINLGIISEPCFSLPKDFIYQTIPSDIHLANAYDAAY